MATATALRSDLRPTERELRWFQHIARHGPQSSEFLYEATRDTHRCKDTALRRLQALRAAGYLRLPPQQRQIAKAEFNPYVYDVTRQGEDCLKARGLWQNELRPTGHWWHGFWVSSVTSAIEIMARRNGMEFVPGRRILDLRGASLAIPLPRGKLVPDQLFALKGRDGYLAYALEVDRGTEPVRSAADRKSLARSLEQYCAVLEDGSARAHYGLTAPLFAIWQFSAPERWLAAREILQQANTGALGAVEVNYLSAECHTWRATYSMAAALVSRHERR